MKQSLYKSIGNGNLRWHELEEVILDVEITLNNRPLGYVKDDVQMSVLTLSAMLYGHPISYQRRRQKLSKMLA